MDWAATEIQSGEWIEKLTNAEIQEISKIDLVWTREQGDGTKRNISKNELQRGKCPPFGDMFRIQASLNLHGPMKRGCDGAWGQERRAITFRGNTG